MPRWVWVVALLLAAGRTVRTEAGSVEAIDFNHDIRPILSQNCFLCHGPDEGGRKGGVKSQGGLRLDTVEGQRADLGGHVAVSPGKPETSDLLKRVMSADPDDLMPPPKTGKRLTSAEVDLLRRWIASGARFSSHWAYEPPVRSPLPAVRKPEWVRNPVDRFILARLEREGLEPQTEADARVLARRVALDLTGLPPSLGEVDGFLSDTAEGAYERYVDRMLAKSAYGEHWARMWLDLARYADSAGYADDPPRTIWPYRDYVIRAFNQNLPFDQFTVEQLAGDLLPDPTEDQLKATAFHRNTMTNSEGGTSDEEFRNVAIVDRVNTTFAVWMGTSMACAQCHTHKYDPITQREYFQLFAFLNNTADADRPDEGPVFEFDSEEVRERRARLTSEFTALDARFQEAEPDLAAAAETWSTTFPRAMHWSRPRPTTARAESGAALEILEDQSVRVSPKGAAVSKDTYTVEIPFDRSLTLSGLRLEALSDPGLKEQGPGLAGDFVVRSVRAKILPVPNQAGPAARFIRLETGRNGRLILQALEILSSGENVARSAAVMAGPTAGADLARLVTGDDPGSTDGVLAGEGDKPWVEFDLGRERPVERITLKTAAGARPVLEGFRVVALDAGRKTVWEQAANPVPKGDVTFDLIGPRDVEFANASADHNAPGLDEALVATERPQSARYRGRRGEKGWSVRGALGRDHELLLALVKPVKVPRGATLSVTIAQQAPGEGQVLGRFALGITTEAGAVEYVDTPAEVREALGLEPPARTPAMRTAVSRYFVRHVAPAFQEARERYAALQRERDGLKPLTVPVMRELEGGARRTTRVQVRGNYLATGEEVAEGVPAAWPPLPDGVPRNRLTLARWLVSPANPLTGRVLANRFWEQIFGMGIVRTSEEFGSQGELPVHPELLDWLAVDLVEGGWDMKRFLRLLVTSAAYRQSSRVTPEALERDPDNRLLSRGPRFRLSAEMVRDQALAASGLLGTRMLGPSVRPPRPSLDLRAAFGGNLDWQASPGEDRYRRGLYTEWRRTSPYPSMATFDAPSREVCTLRRNRSNTPLQALVTLNDPVFVEAAQALAKRMLDAGTTFEDRLGHGFARVLSRPPRPLEREELGTLLQDLRARLASTPDQARALAGRGATTTGGQDLPEVVELAAWTGLANVLLNLDETLMKR